jgi:dihydroorotase
MELLIKNAEVIDWSQSFYGDVYIKDGRIYEIGQNIIKECPVLEAEGLTLLPSFVDLHTHFREPGFTYKEDIETGSLAAVRGGYTAVNLMANTNPICSNMDIVNQVKKRAAEVDLIDIHQTVSITNNLEGKDLSHIEGLDKSVVCLSDDGKGVANSNIMLEAMIKAKNKGITIMSHAESEELAGVDSRLAENTMSWRDILLAKHTGCHLHLAHVSTKEVVNYIIEAKSQGYNITCEVTPHHIALTDEIDYKVNPPLRKNEDIDHIVKAIKDGYIDAIATDHAPHSVEDKAKGANGISGIETAFPVCYTKLVKGGHITLNKLSELMSKNPSYIMHFNKGEIKIGREADLVLVDLNEQYEINSKSFASKGKNSPFHGQKVYGKIVSTIKGGKVIFNER